MARVQLMAGARDFSLPHTIQTGSEANPVNYTMRTRGFLLGLSSWGMKLMGYNYLVLRSRMVEQYLHYPLHFYAVMLNYLSTGPNSPLPLTPYLL
jgi:hypothetical protein